VNAVLGLVNVKPSEKDEMPAALDIDIVPAFGSENALPNEINCPGALPSISALSRCSLHVCLVFNPCKLISDAAALA
jgi:hypothetical protein